MRPFPPDLLPVTREKEPTSQLTAASFQEASRKLHRDWLCVPASAAHGEPEKVEDHSTTWPSAGKLERDSCPISSQISPQSLSASLEVDSLFFSADVGWLKTLVSHLCLCHCHLLCQWPGAGQSVFLLFETDHLYFCIQSNILSSCKVCSFPHDIK